MTTIVDTNVLVDLFHGSSWSAWSEHHLEQARRAGPVAINPIIFAELAAGFATAELLDDAVNPRQFRREDLPWNAALLAGKAFLSYRRAGGDRRSPLPDFYIGAHAVVAGHRLLTRDPARYRIYFPDLEIVAPDTYP